MRNIPLQYANEYLKPISEKLKCNVLWGKFDEYASDVNYHTITSSDYCALSNVKDANDILDAINDTKVPDMSFATFENDFWTLSDGKEMPLVVEKNGALQVNGDNIVGNGWISGTFSKEKDEAQNIAGGQFVVPPVLNIGFVPSQVDHILGASIEGMKISFCKSKKEYAVDFNITYTLAETLQTVTTEIVGNTQTEYSFNFPQAARNKPLKSINITVLKWCLPNRRARVEELTFGLVQEFGSNSLISLEEHRVFNQIGSAVPLSTLEFVVMDQSNFFAEASEVGTSAVAIGQPIQLTWVQQTKNTQTEQREEVEVWGGKYYLKSWQDTGVRSQYKITAETLLSFLDVPYTRGKTYPSGKPASEIIEDVLKTAFPLGNDYYGHWEIDPICATVQIKNPIPLKQDGKICTCASALMMLAQVCGCVLDVYDGDDKNKAGFITVKPLPTDIQSRAGGQTDEVIPLSKVFLTPPKAELKTPLKGAVCNLCSVSYEADKKEVLSATINLPASTQVQEIAFVLSEQVKDHECTIIKDAAAYTNYTVLDNMPEGMITLRFPALTVATEFKISVQGYPLIFNYNEYTNKPFLKYGDIVTVQNPLVHSTDLADKVIAGIEKELKYREEYNIEIKRDLKLQVQDLVQLEKGGKSTNTQAVMVGEKVRVLEITRNLTSVRQKMRMRKTTS